MSTVKSAQQKIVLYSNDLISVISENSMFDLNCDFLLCIYSILSNELVIFIIVSYSIVISFCSNSNFSASSAHIGL